MIVIEVCRGPQCTLNFSIDVLTEAEDVTAEDATFVIRRCGCLGRCEEGPNLKCDETIYCDMDPDKARRLIDGLRASAGRPGDPPWDSPIG